MAHSRETCTRNLHVLHIEVLWLPLLRITDKRPFCFTSIIKYIIVYLTALCVCRRRTESVENLLAENVAVLHGAAEEGTGGRVSDVRRASGFVRKSRRTLLRTYILHSLHVLAEC